MTSQPTGAYDNPAYPDNVYGHALDLLRRHKGIARAGEIHLDIGCGYGRIAEEIQAKTGLVYVGVDGSADGLESLTERGFETHQLWFEGRTKTLSRFEEVIAGRAVGSITFLDTIEHLADGDEILGAIADVARQHLANVVVSTPNVTHRDIGAKLAFGRWNYTDVGLLDHTHVRLFEHSMFAAVLEKAGLLTVDRYDVIRPISEQFFPDTHPALAAGTPLNGLLFDAARLSNPYSDTYQFVWLCAPAREQDRQTFTTICPATRPFITAVVRTQGRRLHTLVEVLTCLAGQTDTDFEIVVVGHKLDPATVKSVERAIDDTPQWLRQKIRLIRVDDGGRSRPLNIGFAEARGRYIAILDDDDIPFGNWVEDYRKLDACTPGRVLRCACVRQDVKSVEISNQMGLRAEGPPERVYPSEYDFIGHLVENKSPPVTLAFPRGAFHDLGLRFDETLDTTEDWDFLLRVSAYCGVASSPEVAGIYRWWIKDESSRSLHSPEEWRAHHEAILRKQDASYFIVPKGGLAAIRRLVANRHHEAEPSIAYTAPNFDFECLNSIEEAIACGRKLTGTLPKDLARTLRKGLRRKILGLKFKCYLSILNEEKRRAYRKKRRIYRQFLNEFH
jgi:glycosyltransferase involved in cell wall biosynthesis/SAM-dependent methyltransferase